MDTIAYEIVAAIWLSGGVAAGALVQLLGHFAEIRRKVAEEWSRHPKDFVFVLVILPLFLLVPVALGLRLEFTLFQHAAHACFWVSGLLALIFSRQVFSRIDEGTVRVHTLLFWYAVFLHRGHPAALFFVAAGLPFTLFTVVQAFRRGALGAAARAAFYLWFLLLTGAMIAFQFSDGDLHLLLRPGEKAIEAGPSLFLTGMVFFLLSVRAWSFLVLVPLPGRNQSFKERRGEIARVLDFFAGRFGGEDLPVRRTLLVTILAGGLLGGNAAFQLLPPDVVVNATLVGLPLVARSRDAEEEAA